MKAFIKNKVGLLKGVRTLINERDVARQKRNVARQKRDLARQQRNRARQQRDKMWLLENERKEKQDLWKSYSNRHDRIGQLIKSIVEKHGIKSGKVLEIGGRTYPYKDDVFSGYEYYSIDIKKTGDEVIVADITNCPELEENQFDFIFSVDVFEHINAPWLAAKEITRLLKPGGVTFHSTIFSWRYHPCPSDYWRFTPDALKFIFDDLEHDIAEFDDLERRRNIVGSGRNQLELDPFGGWRENWRVNYSGKKYNF